jgi:hypothetical protein
LSIRASGYSRQVAQLLTLGECDYQHWHDYGALGIRAEQIADLISLVENDELYLDPEKPEVWAPIHAWRALGQLRAEEAVGSLLGILWQVDEYGSDWVGEEVPRVLGMIGPGATPLVTEFLGSASEGLWARTAAAGALEEIGKRHPEARDACIAALVEVLQDFADHDPSLNASLIGALIELEAVGAAPVMEQAFAANCVNLSVNGDWEEVQIELGLLQERLTPKPEFGWLPDIFRPVQAKAEQPRTQREQQRQAERRRKSKRKAQRKRQKRARRQKRKRK